MTQKTPEKILGTLGRDVYYAGPGSPEITEIVLNDTSVGDLQG